MWPPPRCCASAGAHAMEGTTMPRNLITILIVVILIIVVLKLLGMF